MDAGVPADAFGIGTQLGTSGDAPSLGGAYKLVEDERGPRIKLSTGKATTPGRKQIYRFSRGGESYDLITLEDEDVPGGRPLLEKVMEDGNAVRPSEPLAQLRERCKRAISSLPRELLSLEGTQDPYPVRLSDRLQGFGR